MDTTRGFGLYMDRTVKTIQAAFQKMLRDKKVELTLEQWVFLQQIYELGGETSQKELTNLNFRTRATTSKMINNLEQLGYVHKSRFDGDFKQFKLTLTDKGRKTTTLLLPAVKELRAIGHEHITSEDFNIFLNVMNQIWENYKAITSETDDTDQTS